MVVEFNKSYLKSKTLWINAIAFIALVVQGFFGFPISPEIQAGILVIINVILRSITKDTIEWK